MVQLPEFIKELIWTFYPPRYKQLSEQHLHKSIAFMTKMLLVSFLIAGIIFVPKLFLLKGTIENELGKFDQFKLSGQVQQSERVNIPRSNPWIVVDLNNNVTLAKEALVIDQDSVKYRFFGIKSVPRDQLEDPAQYKSTVSRFATLFIILLIPGVALLLFLRSWLKYFLMLLVIGTLWFIVLDLSKFRLRWKQMLNIAAHTLTPIILIETISATITTAFLVPLGFRFVGLNIYLVTLALYAIITAVCIIGCHLPEKRKR